MPKALELIADIGGSSSRWTLLSGDDGAIPLIGVLPGFNPAVNDPATFADALRPALQEALAERGLSRLTVYGAGCGTEERKQRMRSVLAAMVAADEVIVETDLLGAARGLCGDGPGLVLILGTGMNAGWYDGTQLLTPMPSLGWILGDEGSGADIGKRLLNDAVHGRVPHTVMRSVMNEDELTADAALHVLSGSASPNSAVAAYAGRLMAAVDDRYVQELLADRFAALGSLLHAYFGSHTPCTVSAAGGIASGFRGSIKTSLGVFGFDLQRVEADPMEGLIAWHRALLRR
jgi:N-acetylglucosamine kinase-like BadF-type ATPase